MVKGNQMFLSVKWKILGTTIVFACLTFYIQFIVSH